MVNKSALESQSPNDQQSAGNNSETPIEFVLNGDTIRGTFYLPEGCSAPVPAVVLAHGWSMVAGGDLEEYAKKIVSAGMAALTFDFRRLGRSDGQPRQEIDPSWQVEDYRAAITYLCTRPEVDRGRIGIWGSSYSGGHALVVAAIDKRVKCVVSQVPTIDGFSAAQRRVSYDKAKVLLRAFEQDRENRFAGHPPATIRLIDVDPSANVAYPGVDSYTYMGGESERCPTWVNEVTLRSLELARAYIPGAYIKRIAPTPLLMIVASEDSLTPTDMQQEAFQMAHEPKRLLLLSGGHYSVYTDHFQVTSTAAADWFKQYLF